MRVTRAPGLVNASTSLIRGPMQLENMTAESPYGETGGQRTNKTAAPSLTQPRLWLEAERPLPTEVGRAWCYVPPQGAVRPTKSAAGPSRLRPVRCEGWDRQS